MKNIVATTIIALVIGITSFLPTNFDTTVQAHSVAASNSPLLGDACRNVKFKFKNNHSSRDVIDVRDVEYFNRANGKWQTEDLKNRPGMAGFMCGFGETCTTEAEDLRDSEGEQITKIRFHFKFKQAGRNLTSWSEKVVSSIFEPESPVCNANKVFGNGKGWTIGEQP